MKQAWILFAVVAGILLGLSFLFGFGTAYAIGYGAITLMAVAISLTFLWLWYKRTTPLALGMSFSWAGAASVMGWWWLYALLDRPAVLLENDLLLFFLALYCVGAILHFTVIQASLSLPRIAYAVPVVGSVALSAALYIYL
ncbi:MAG: hypothetical protein AAF871_11820 [Pseudomonadota bacterium]